jgi:glycerophosphoryl diester phosphodiesterase
LPRPLVIAHRGASWELPENTLPAFERAIELGADFVEFDVHTRPDGRLVVTHDTPTLKTEAVPLEEVLDLCHGRIGVMVELKRPHRYRRFDVIARTLALMTDDDVLVCFQGRPIRVARTLRPKMRTVQHVATVSVREAAARGCWAVGFRNADVTARRLALAHGLGLVTTAYTVNDPARMGELAGLGVGGIFTDRPDLALETLSG